MTPIFRRAAFLIALMSLLMVGCEGDDEIDNDAESSEPGGTESSMSSAAIDEQSKGEEPDLVQAEATPTLASNDDPSASETTPSEADSSTTEETEGAVAPDGWTNYDNSTLGLSISFPADWKTVNELDGSIFLSNIEAADCGSCRFLPSGTITVTIMPNVEPPFAQGERIAVGVDDYQASLFRQDPWGYREADRIVDVFYGAASTTWMVRATFTEHANDANPNLAYFLKMLDTIQHDSLSTSPELAPVELSMYDRESAYRNRISRDVTSLRTSIEHLEVLFQPEERTDPDWNEQVSDTIRIWGKIYEDTLSIEPPESYRDFHSGYVKSLFYFTASDAALWNSEGFLAHLFLGLAGENLRAAFEHWSQPYDPDLVEPAVGASEATERLRHTIPVGGLSLEYMWQHFGEPDALLTLHRLHLPSDHTDILVQGRNGAMEHVRFGSEYMNALAGHESSIETLGFEDLGNIISDFVTGSGEWTTTQAYAPVAAGVELGDHELEYYGIVDIIQATSHTMSDQRRGIILSTFQRFHDDYLRSLLSDEHEDSFMDFIAANAGDTILDRYGWEFGD